MATAPTYDDLFEAGLRELLIKPTRYNPLIARDEGSDVNVALAWAAAMAEECARFLQTAFAENHLGTAAAVSSESLQRWVYDRYRMTKREAQAAVVTLELRRTDAASGVTVPEGSQFSTATGVTFRTVNDVVFPSGSTGPFSVVAVAEQTGISGRVAADLINTVVSQLDDSTVTVINPDPSAGGTDEQTDDDLESAAREFFNTAERGTKAAVLRGALDTAGVTRAQAIEFLEVETGNPFFRGSVIISDDEGQANAALADRTRLNLASWRGFGVPVSVIAGTPLFIDIVLSGLRFEADSNTTNVRQQARRAVVAAVNSLAPSQTLEVAVIISALKSVPNLIVPAGAVVSPVGDLVPASGRVIRTTLDRVSIT